jgi:hypothetical protein
MDKIFWAIKQAVGLAVDPLAFTALTRLLPARACGAHPAHQHGGDGGRPIDQLGQTHQSHRPKGHRVAKTA